MTLTHEQRARAAHLARQLIQALAQFNDTEHAKTITKSFSFDDKVAAIAMCERVADALRYDAGVSKLASVIERLHEREIELFAERHAAACKLDDITLAEVNAQLDSLVVAVELVEALYIREFARASELREMVIVTKRPELWRVK
jgi:hypothetical protein